MESQDSIVLNVFRNAKNLKCTFEMYKIKNDAKGKKEYVKSF